MEVLVYCLAAAAAAGILVYVLCRQAVRSAHLQLEAETRRARELEKVIHTNETGHLEARNAAEVRGRSELNEVREASFREGLALGRVESEKDHLIAVTQMRGDFRDEIALAKEAAAEEARVVLRAEVSAQTKLFSVAISPYVKVQKDKGLIWDEHKSYVGYQYQLLVNGIPAFQPHVMIEKTEEYKEVDKETVMELIRIAEQSAQKAVELYLSGAPEGVIKRGAAVLENARQ
ncbi:hypothetical protein ACLB90_06260 [Stenotrophomonas sp. LGBM10]|uniref:hypothetical protein n=1 Tax=Stenotrophomonas sp. LGBM10 TaxID=3390038 RepID=UPI00398B52BB